MKGVNNHYCCNWVYISFFADINGNAYRLCAMYYWLSRIMYTIDFSAAITQLGLVPYSTVSRYIMSIIPLFTFMGSLVFNSE